MIEILTDSPLNSVQDLGRPRAMALGVARGGAMDPLALRLGNAMLGNAGDSAGIEVAFFPFRLRLREDRAVAVTGAHGPFDLDGMVLPSDWAMPGRAGQVLTLHGPHSGARAHVAVAGGVEVAEILGSRSTDLKGGFGGLEGRALRAGDVLRCGPAAPVALPAHGFGLASPCVPPSVSEATLRVVAAAETEAFTAASRRLFETAAWQVTRTANRTGCRLDGAPRLELRHPLSLLSHGIVPGTVQVPPAGLPIVQMADANTCGGYPKIATVIEPDLRVLAQMPVGGRIRFAFVGRDDAVQAMRDEATRVARTERAIARLLREAACA